MSCWQSLHVSGTILCFLCLCLIRLQKPVIHCMHNPRSWRGSLRSCLEVLGESSGSQTLVRLPIIVPVHSSCHILFMCSRYRCTYRKILAVSSKNGNFQFKQYCPNPLINWVLSMLNQKALTRGTLDIKGTAMISYRGSRHRGLKYIIGKNTV